MKAFAFAMTLTLCAHASAEKPSPADTTMEQFRDAWTKDDADAVLALFTDDVVLVGGGPDIANGKEAVSTWARKQVSATGAMTVTAVRTGMVGDVAYHVGRWTLGRFTGTHTFLFKKNKGGWKIFSMHIDNDPEPEPSPAPAPAPAPTPAPAPAKR